MSKQMEFIVGLHVRVWWLHVFLPISGVINKTETLYNSTSQLSLQNLTVTFTQNAF